MTASPRPGDRADPRPQLILPRNHYMYRAGASEVPESVAVNVRNRSYTIGALVDIPGPGRREFCSRMACGSAATRSTSRTTGCSTSTTSSASPNSTSSPPKGGAGGSHERTGWLYGPNRSVNDMTSRSGFTPDEARAAGARIGIDWDTSQFDVEQFRKGMDIELEHGARDPETNVTHDDVTMTAKIARAHLNEFPDYYTRLAKMEAEAEANRDAPDI